MHTAVTINSIKQVFFYSFFSSTIIAVWYRVCVLGAVYGPIGLTPESSTSRGRLISYDSQESAVCSRLSLTYVPLHFNLCKPIKDTDRCPCIHKHSRTQQLMPDPEKSNSTGPLYIHVQSPQHFLWVAELIPLLLVFTLNLSTLKLT